MNSNLLNRLAKIESKRRSVLLPLVVFYREAIGLTFEQQERINRARAVGQPVRIIKTMVVN